ncbi:hypothetical protein [Nocardia aurantia]|uniref:Uncharacterized protein n=1 Tax=Nocardia aurantia TaxID=2585199 RepID=A0A7K0DSG6_9NOCA|nr:hypothetical protein [Nocardia aurantia]MQY28715.1 hypothetical protein [Nocardia aurantia]
MTTAPATGFQARRIVESAAAFCGAVVAGMSLMVPLDPRMMGNTSALEVSLTVLNAPRSAAAGAMLAVVAAVYVVIFGARVAWSASFACALVLLICAAVVAGSVSSGSLAIVNFIECVMAGILIGALAAATLRRPGVGTAYTVGILSGIVIGDQLQTPQAGETVSRWRWVLAGAPPLGVSILAVALLGAGLYWHRNQAPIVPESTVISNIPLVPILAGALMLSVVTTTSEWTARYELGAAGIIGGVVALAGAAVVAALLLPGRDGTLILLATALAAAGSAVVAVPHPSWTWPLTIVIVALGFLAGRRRSMPLVAAGLTVALAVYAAFTCGIAHTYLFLPAIGCVATAFVLGYGFGAAVPHTVSGMVLGIVVLVAPCMIVALRGQENGTVGYSPSWYRDPNATEGLLPPVTAIALTFACTLGILLIHQLRPVTVGHVQRLPGRAPGGKFA